MQMCGDYSNVQQRAPPGPPRCRAVVTPPCVTAPPLPPPPRTSRPVSQRSDDCFQTRVGTRGDAATPAGRPHRLPTHERLPDVPLLEFQVMDGSSGEEAAAADAKSCQRFFRIVIIRFVWDERRRSEPTASEGEQRLLNRSITTRPGDDQTRAAVCVLAAAGRANLRRPRQQQGYRSLILPSQTPPSARRHQREDGSAASRRNACARTLAASC